MAADQPGAARPRDKSAFLARVDAAWAELDALVANADAARLTLPGPGGWSAKDYLVHLSVWEGRLLAVLDGRTLRDYLGIDRAEVRALGTDGLNSRLHAQHRDRPLEEVLGGWRDTHARLRTVLGRTDLAADWPDPDDPADREPLLGTGVLDGNTYEHYEEHTAAVRALLG